MKMKAMLAFTLVLLALLTACAGGAAPTETTQAPTQASEETGTVETTQAAEETTQPTEATEAPLADGVYTAEFNTDSGMFHANESCDGKGTLTVENGVMTFHVSLASKSIVNLYLGLAEDAQKDGAKLLEPTVDTVTYSDGLTDEVYGFDIPIPAVNQEFDLALIGKKGVWYDHKVSVDNPQPMVDGAE